MKLNLLQGSQLSKQRNISDKRYIDAIWKGSVLNWTVFKKNKLIHVAVSVLVVFVGISH